MATLGLNPNTDGDVNGTKQIQVEIQIRITLGYTTGVNIIEHTLFCQETAIRDYSTLLKSNVSLQCFALQTDIDV